MFAYPDSGATIGQSCIKQSSHFEFFWIMKIMRIWAAQLWRGQMVIMFSCSLFLPLISGSSLISCTPIYVCAYVVYSLFTINFRLKHLCVPEPLGIHFFLVAQLETNHRSLTLSFTSQEVLMCKLTFPIYRLCSQGMFFLLFIFIYFWSISF